MFLAFEFFEGGWRSEIELEQRLGGDRSFDQTYRYQTNGQENNHLLKVMKTWTTTQTRGILVVGVF